MTGRRRKGARRLADVSPDDLSAFNQGKLETITLVEWLAIDMRVLVRHIAPAVGLAEDAEALGQVADELAGLRITRRLRGMGQALFRCLRGRKDAVTTERALASHPSEMVRSWAAYAVAADATLDLSERLRRVRPFAADHHGSVGEIAWDSLRPYLSADLSRALSLLVPWVQDPDANVRRCAVEATRPRGVWCAHIEALKQHPEQARPLLEPVRADASNYVQRSVANWLNDASKTRPEWVRALCTRWQRESPGAATAWITRHALRTLRRQQGQRNDAAA